MNKALEDLLTWIKYTPDPCFQDTNVTNVQFISGENILKLSLELKEVVEIEKLLDFNSVIKNGLINTQVCKNVEMKYNYIDRNIDKELLEKYYNFTLNILKKKNILYSALENYKTVLRIILLNYM